MVLTKALFWIFEILSFWFCTFFFALTWDPKAAKTSKRYSSHKSLLIFFQSFPRFSSEQSWRKCCLGFLKFWVNDFNDFFCKFKVSHCALWINCKVRDRHVVTMYINRKPYMESEMTPSHLTLSDLEGQSQGHSDFAALYLVKEQSLAICYY